MEAWLDFAGRLHPLVVHLPIGILFLLVVLEIWNRVERWQAPPEQQTRKISLRSLVLFCFASSAIASSVFGWFLAMDGGYGEALLLYHRITGIAVTVLGVVLFILRNRPIWYGFTLVATIVVMVMAGHYGGSLTHGKGYLEDALFKALNPESEAVEEAGKAVAVVAKAPSDFIIYDTFIHPVLMDKCASCHGEEKMRGDLRLDSYAHLMQGGDYGPSVEPGDLENSELIFRLWLPLEDEERMPPEGKPQLTPEEVRLMEWWVETGASETATLADIALPRDMEPTLYARLGLKVNDREPLPERAAVIERSRELEASTGVQIRLLDPVNPYVEVVARFRGEAFGDGTLADLAPLERVIQRLDLGQTAVTDPGLAALKSMENLQVLKLDGTKIGDVAMVHLKGLTQLESLNLVGTRVGDEGIQQLSHMESLRQVFVWQTYASESGADALELALTDARKIGRLRDDIASLEKQISIETAQVNIGGYTAPDVRPQVLEPEPEEPAYEPEPEPGEEPAEAPNPGGELTPTEDAFPEPLDPEL